MTFTLCFFNHCFSFLAFKLSYGVVCNFGSLNYLEELKSFWGGGWASIGNFSGVVKLGALLLRYGNVYTFEMLTLEMDLF